MSMKFATAMRRAAASTRKGDLGDATSIIQGALTGHPASAPGASPSPSDTDAKGLIGRSPIGVGPQNVSGEDDHGAGAGKSDVDRARFGPYRSAEVPRFRKPLGSVVEMLRNAKRAFSNEEPHLARARPCPSTPAGSRFEWKVFSCRHGARDYMVFVPSSVTDAAEGLIIMLHGCTQDPQDFAAGTKMNTFGETHRLVIAYPSQTNADNASSCWNWFDPGHQKRDAGEPAIIAGITRTLMNEFHVDRDKTFVAGLSAGGAAAVIMGRTCADLYSAVGVHSGLSYACANDVMTAFAAMRGDGSAIPPASNRSGPPVRTIVFHGTADTTVHPSNAERIVAAAATDGADDSARWSERGVVNGRGFTRSIVDGPDGDRVAEHWLIEGAGHAWSGGDAGGTFTDAKGPDASAEMVRFFLNPC